MIERLQMPWLVISIFAFSVLFTNIVSAEPLKTGEWEFTSVISFSDPLKEPANVTSKICMTAQEAVDGGQGSFRAPTPDCKRTITPNSSNSYTVKYVCGEGKSRGTWNVRYTQTSMENEMTIEVSNANEQLRITSKSSGRWIGPCQQD